MIPVLFKGTETAFTGTGLGRLSDAASCKVTENRNGTYELDMEYPLTGAHYSIIKNGIIILAKANATDQAQPFRIYSISRPISGIVTIHAQHISYDLAGVPVAPFTATGITAVLKWLKSNTLTDCPFTFSSTLINEKSTYTQSTIDYLRNRLGGVEGSLLDVFGGEYHFDRYNVNLMLHRGSASGVTILYGKNLQDVTQEESIDSTYTGCIAYWTPSDDNGSTVYGSVQYAENHSNFPTEKIYILDTSQEYKEAPTADTLNTRAQKYITDNNFGVPKVSITAKFVDLSQVAEYAGDTTAKPLSLCDTVTVKYTALGVDATAKVISTTYDTLAERYDAISLGDAKSNFVSAVTSIADKAADNAKAAANANANGRASEISTQMNLFSQLITQGLGLHFITEYGKLYMCNRPTRAESQYQYTINSNGFAVSKDYGKTWTAGIDSSGNAVFNAICANVVKALNIEASSIDGTIITGSKITWDDGAGHAVAAQAGAVKNNSVSSGGVTFTGGGFSAQCDMAELKSKTSDGTQYAQVETYLYNGKPFAAMHNETYSSTDPHLAYVITNDKLASMSASVSDKVSYINTTPTCTYIGSSDTSSSRSKKSSVNVTPENVDITTTGNVNIQPDGALYMKSNGNLSLLTTDDMQISANGTVSIKGDDTVAVGAGKNVVLGTISAPTKINGSTVIVNMGGQQLVQPDENNSKLLDYYNGYSYGLPVVAYNGGSSDGNHSIGLMWTGSELVVQVDKTAVGTVQFKS